MNKATLVKDGCVGFTGNAALYRMEPKLQGHRYVIVSATDYLDGEAETYIFPASRYGKVTEWGELAGSHKGTFSHKKALELAGYEIQTIAESLDKG